MTRLVHDFDVKPAHEHPWDPSIHESHPDQLMYGQVSTFDQVPVQGALEVSVLYA